MKHVGIDISKNDFWVSFKGHQKSFLQTKRGLTTFLNWLKKYNLLDAIIVMEATGVYHLRLAVFLRDSGILVDVVNPQRLYHHGRSCMARVVNDSSAARNVEDFASKNGLKGGWKPMPDEIEQLRWWLNQGDKLKAEITVYTNQLESLKMRPAEIADRITYLENRIGELRAAGERCDQEAERLVKSNYSEESKLFESIPGIGKKTSMALIAFYCSHYQINNPKQALVLAGLSLRRHTSGTSIEIRTKITKMGYGYLRKCLYMAALTASKCNPACKELYDRLLERKKSKKSALIAVSCKLLRQSFGVWNSRELYNEEKSKFNLEEKKVKS